jgi:nitrogen PTS system EIIA component
VTGESPDCFSRVTGHALFVTGSPMKINGLLQEEDIIPDLAAGTKEQLLRELAAKVEERHPPMECSEIFHVLLEREKLGSTGVGDGVAIPHGKLKGAAGLVLAFGRSAKGVDFDALDGKKSHLFFLLIAPEDAFGIHLKMLGRISRILKDPAVRKSLLEAPHAAAIHDIIQEQDNRY